MQQSADSKAIYLVAYLPEKKTCSVTVCTSPGSIVVLGSQASRQLTTHPLHHHFPDTI
jgi:hypothetical protein